MLRAPIKSALRSVQMRKHQSAVPHSLPCEAGANRQDLDDKGRCALDVLPEASEGVENESTSLHFGSVSFVSFVDCRLEFHCVPALIRVFEVDKCNLREGTSKTARLSRSPRTTLHFIGRGQIEFCESFRGRLESLVVALLKELVRTRSDKLVWESVLAPEDDLQLHDIN
eukprot:1103161-Amphidinium_carterae.1